VWQAGETIVRREVVHDSPWSEFPVVVVRDEPELLVTYLAAGTRFSFPPHPLVHPWRGGHNVWQGHGMLMLQRPGDRYAVFVFWHGPEREFRSWYLNLQDPFRRHDVGYDTHDHELDLILHTDGRIERKDDELLDVRVEEGRFTQDQACDIRAEGRRLEAELATRGHWWDAWWALWEPDPAWDRVGDPA
jgi:predicted RNA-binding protein associated with RNAse of E/G family